MAERVGDRIRERRKALRLTGAELARRVGAAGKEVVSVWENRSTPPDQPYLGRLARLFGVTEAWLRHGDAVLDENAQQRIEEARVEGYNAAVRDMAREVATLAQRLADDYIARLKGPTLTVIQSDPRPDGDGRGRSGEAIEAESQADEDDGQSQQKDRPAG